MSKKVYHVPDGDPCKKCGKSRGRHRVDHKPNGEPCDCGLPLSKHRFRDENRSVEYFGIDGEGQGRKDHRYVLLAASNEKGDKVWTVEDHRLSTEDCLDLILSLPTKRAKIFSFSFNYDLTKILTDVDNESLYFLFRPELRPAPIDPTGKKSSGPRPVKWRGYYLNLQGTKFTVRKGGRKVVIWDLFKFFQAKFVNALKDWKVGNEELWKRMSLMKDKRSEFDKEDPEDVKAYCLEETRCIAELARRLIEAHEAAELKLRSFYGAGSSGAAMLTRIGVKDKTRAPPDKMKPAVAAGFAGGRFENSIIGEANSSRIIIPTQEDIDDLIYNRDISSAYPYHTAFLPCLEHATWRISNKRHDLDNARAALVHYGLGPNNENITSWGPFPFRTEDGSIAFPIESGGGWVWLDEYLAGERIFNAVQFREAWIYESDCDCKPFEKIPEYYVLRLRIGKEGPGIVIKLGINSCYGKLAQSVGSALFNCWIWAGMITSGCRAQVLDMLGLHQNWSNLLAVATDGIYTREKLLAPLPRETGTGLIIDGKSKPLGGWEEKVYDRGMFFARPGIYFPMNPTKEDIKDIRGRGVGKGVVLENWQIILDTWMKEGLSGIARVANVSRFCGAKTSISRSGKAGHYRYKRANWKDGIQPSYGQWITRKVEMGFDPKPKRDGFNRDGTLALRKFPRDLESVAYDRAMISKDTIAMKTVLEEALEQPEVDLSEYEMEMGGT